MSNVPGQTVIGMDDDLAVKIFSVALFVETQRRNSLIKLLTGKMSKAETDRAYKKRERMETTPDMPVVKITEMQSGVGTKVSCDMFHDMSGLPMIGDEVAEGRGEGQSFASMEMIINQTRKPAAPGAKMSHDRTKHKLRRVAVVNLSKYFLRLLDQTGIVHLSGARGTAADADWIVPQEDHEKFSKMMINDVLPPTTNRYYIAGEGMGALPSAIEATNVLKLEDLDVLTAGLREMAYPPAPVKLKHDKNMDEMSCYILLVSERQWMYLKAKAGVDSWRGYMADATKRMTVWKHPIFTGEVAWWEGMLIRRMSRPVRFGAGATIKRTDADDGAVLSTNISSDDGFNVDRALLIGGQALFYAEGNRSRPGDGVSGDSMTDSIMASAGSMFWSEKTFDHNNTTEILGGKVDGFKKARFKGTDGKITDFGIVAVDSYAPDVFSEQGRALVAALKTT